MDSWYLNAKRSRMRPTKTEVSFRTVLAVLKGATHTHKLHVSTDIWGLEFPNVKKPQMETLLNDLESNPYICAVCFEVI